ncbi:uncharacterized protein UV8b_03108 [Ustilaginoidea virens]|uniref:Uncharacterized protein n=1 Tax=Ustilaginoidea virens TaxID=1159556 RepID=A0A8E5HP37_USTVR|nr:uncharacterized protein UV8b_03108 [Ustilaginoidea virens]QUC18867.1 hypothetical protein UV8b_03108 [Ustilaginoidea virens]
MHDAQTISTTDEQPACAAHDRPAANYGLASPSHPNCNPRSNCRDREIQVPFFRLRIMSRQYGLIRSFGIMLSMSAKPRGASQVCNHGLCLCPSEPLTVRSLPSPP